MTCLGLSRRIANIVVYGHLALFAYAIFVMLEGPYDKNDTIQMMLMGSPILSMTGLSAYKFISGLNPADQSPLADPTWVQMSTTVTSLFIVALLVVYSMAIFDSNVSMNTLKIIVGAIETTLGGYLGITRDVLFPEAKGK